MPVVFVTFLSDFGPQDDFVGTCHGVIKKIAPEVQIIDVTHGISPQHVLQGALVLAKHHPLHAIGRSSGRGRSGSRQAHAALWRCAAATAGSSSAPTTGSWCRRPSGLAELSRPHELANADYALRQRLAHVPRPGPVAPGRRATSRPESSSAALGPPSRPTTLARLDLPEPRSAREPDHATVLYIDRFGNVQVNLTREHLHQAEVPPGKGVEIDCSVDRYYAVAARTSPTREKAT